MDNGHALQLAHHGGIQEVLQCGHRLVGHHSPQVDLAGHGGGTQGVLRPGDDLAGLLLCLGLSFHHPDFLLFGCDIQDPGLKLEHSVLVYGQHRGSGAHLHQLHCIPFYRGPGGGRRLDLRAGAANVPLRLVQQPAGLCPAVIHLLPIQPVLTFSDLFQLSQCQIAGRPGLVYDRPGLRLGFGHGLLPLLFQLLAVLPGLGGGLLHLQLQLPGLFPLLLHLLPLLIQAGQHILKPHVLRVQPGGGLLDDVLRQAQPPGDGEGVGLARDAQHQPVGGGQGVHIELTGGIFHPLRGHSVHL